MVDLRVTCYCFLSYFVAAVSGQTDCRNRFPDVRSWIPANWRTILDSTDYDFLISGSGSVWVPRDVDGDGDSFVQTGGVCTRSAYTCLFGTTANNWLFTQYLSFGSANEVFFNVSYDFRDCNFVPNCHPYVTLFRYDRNSVGNAAQQINPSNYQYLTGSETTSQFGTASTGGGIQVTGIERPSSFTGFYLGIQDTGTCGTVRRVLVYYLVCPARVSGLVSFPQTPVPPRSSANTVYSGSCAPNSHAATSLEVEITSTTSVCTERAPGGARCECDAGYSINGTSCEACSAGQYRALNQSQTTCNSCPSLTVTTVEAASICECLTGYYRSSQEGPETGCTSPPGPVQSLSTASTTSTTATISWNRPASTGRSDYYYYIGRSDPSGSATSITTVNSRLVNTASTVTYTVTDLEPYEDYVITVIAHNGVSDQDSNNVGSRTRTTEARTMQAIPGTAPMVTPLCTVVVWQPPTTPNGEIQGYDIRFSSGAEMSLSASLNFHVTTEAQRTANPPVQVRAINGAGAGPWSDATLICQDACSLPFNRTATSTSINLEWTRPGGASSNDYVIQLSGGGGTRSFTITNSGNSLTYTISGLTPFTSYVIDLRNGQLDCSKTVMTLEGVPTSVTQFQQFCEVIVWRPPLQVQGDLEGFSLQFRFTNGTVQTLSLESSLLFYTTTMDQRKAGVKTRIRAFNGENQGDWTSFDSNGCEMATSGSCNLSKMATTDTSVSLRWSRPASVSGNNYEIYVHDGATLRSLTVTDSGENVNYIISSLKPFTSYIVNVTIDDSSCSVIFRTSEGVPGTAPIVTPLCTVVVWEPPITPNGVIQGYQIRFSSGAEISLSASLNFYVTTEAQRTTNPPVQVRAINGAGAGPWSDPIMLICQDACSLPFSGTATSTSINLEWTRPGGASSNDYVIQLSGGGGTRSFTVTNSGNSLTHTISGLTPFTSYVIDLRNRQLDCSNTVMTLEGVPTSVTQFQQFCEVIVWRPPLQVQGDLEGFSLQFLFTNGTEQTLSVESSLLFYKTTMDQRKAGIKTRIRAFNGANHGDWTSFDSNGCEMATSGSCNLSKIATTDTSVSLRWSRPASVSGNNYEIYVHDGATLRSLTVTDSGGNVNYIILSLKPFTSYIVNVTIDDSSCSVTFRTSEGVPETAPIVTPLCAVVVWQPPITPNGVIQGYQIRFSSGAEMSLSASLNFHVTTEAQRTTNPSVQVRAINGAGAGPWSDPMLICQDTCSLPFNGTATNSSIHLEWTRPGGASSNDYVIQLSSGGGTRSFTVTNSGNSLTHTISELTPFTSYIIDLRNGQMDCSKAIMTLEGAPSSPRDFKQFCNVVTWNVPSDVQGELSGYELDFKSSKNKVHNETVQLGSSKSFHPTTADQRKTYTEVRIRANNMKHKGNWTSFFSIGCEEVTSANSGSAILSTISAIDVIVIVLITAAVCFAICVLIVVIVYVCYKCCSKTSTLDQYSKKKSNNDVKLENLY